MTRALKSFHTEKLGISEVISVCAKARTIFRETKNDVGIDGFIEVTEEGISTGIIAGIQIKSGDSFVNTEGTKFTFRSDQDHFGYWARCSFPVIGVVFSPKYKKSVWIDLTSLSTDKRIVEGPYSIVIEYTNETAFTPSNLLSQIIPTILKYTSQRRTLWQIKELIKPKRKNSLLLVPNLEVGSAKEDAWYKLIEILFASNSGNEEIVDAGYRLSWYFPSVSKKLRDALKKKLIKIDDFSLVRIIGAIHMALVEEMIRPAELIADLFRYIPNICARIEDLLKNNKIPAVYREAAIQIIEYLEGEFKSKLRKEIQPAS